MSGKEQKSVTVEGSLDPLFVVGALDKRGFQAIHEPGLGHGYAITVGHEDTEARVGVFPQVNAVQIVSGSSILRLEKIVRVRRRDEHLVLEALENEERVTLEISPEGRFALIRQPLLSGSGERIAEVSPAPMSTTTAPMAPEATPVNRRRADGGAGTPAKQSASSGSGELPTAAENERVTIRGRVGSEARFRQSGRRGMLIGTFPLGEHPDLETTIWHTVVVFGDRAQKLHEKGLTKGQEIEVVGYIHERQVNSVKSTAEDQGSKLVKELYATAIRTTLRKTSEKDSS